MLGGVCVCVCVCVWAPRHCTLPSPGVHPGWQGRARWRHPPFGVRGQKGILPVPTLARVGPGPMESPALRGTGTEGPAPPGPPGRRACPHEGKGSPSLSPATGRYPRGRGKGSVPPSAPAPWGGTSPGTSWWSWRRRTGGWGKDSFLPGPRFPTGHRVRSPGRSFLPFFCFSSVPSTGPRKGGQVAPHPVVRFRTRHLDQCQGGSVWPGRPWGPVRGV